MLITSAGPTVLFLIISGMGVSLNKALTYGAKKRALPYHLAQANANRRFQSDLLKENQAVGNVSTSYSKKSITLLDSSDTPTHPVISTQPSCTSCSNAVSLGEYQKIKRKANAAIDRAMKTKQSAKKY